MVLRSKAALSGEVFKESFIDIFHTNLEQVAFSLQSTKAIDQDNYSFQTELPYKCQCPRSAFRTRAPLRFAVPLRSKKGHAKVKARKFVRQCQCQSLIGKQIGKKIGFASRALCLQARFEPMHPFGLPCRALTPLVACPFLPRRGTASRGTATRGHGLGQEGGTACVPLLAVPLLAVPLRGKQGHGNYLRAPKGQLRGTAPHRTAPHATARHGTARHKICTPIFGWHKKWSCLALLTSRRFVSKEAYKSLFCKQRKSTHGRQKIFKNFVLKSISICKQNTCLTPNFKYESKKTPILLNRRIGDYFSSGDKIGHFLPDKGSMPFSFSKKRMCLDYKSCACRVPASLAIRRKTCVTNLVRAVLAKQRFVRLSSLFYNAHTVCVPLPVTHSCPFSYKSKICTCNGNQRGAKARKQGIGLGETKQRRTNLCFVRHGTLKQGTQCKHRHVQQHICSKSLLLQLSCKQNRCKKSFSMVEQKIGTPIILNSSGRVVTISKTQLILQKTQPVLFYNSANLHVKKGEWVKEGSPILTLTHQTLITGDIVQGIPRIEQLFEAFTSPPSAFKDRDRTVTKFKDVHDTLHSQVRDIFRKHWFKNVLPIAVRKSLEEIQYILVESIQKVYLSQGVLISDKHIEIIIRQIASKGQILDSGSTGLFLEEILPIRQIENANLTTPGKKCLYVPAVVGLTAAALSSDSFISAASFQETTRVLSRDAVVGKSDFLRGLKEKVVIGDLISAGTGLDIYFIYTTMMSR